MTENTELLGVGIYSVPEAARLTRVSSRKIRRWLLGYSYPSKEGARRVPPIWSPELPIVDDQLALGFLDLLEVRFVDAFRRHGVSWNTIRLAARRAAEILQVDHPFATRAFKTDGHTIFADLANEAGDPRLLDLTRSQYALREFLAPHLYRGIEFSDRLEPQRWRPMPKNREVVVDPDRQFGRPIIDSAGVPTDVLAAAVRAEGSIERVSRWFEVKKAAVRAAVDFEDYLEKAA